MYWQITLGASGSYVPLISNHPLSTRISEKSSNFKGLGLNPPNQFDDTFIYTYSLEKSFDVCFKNMSKINDVNCLSESEMGVAKGLSPIPSTSSVIVMVSSLFEYLSNDSVTF